VPESECAFLDDNFPTRRFSDSRKFSLLAIASPSATTSNNDRKDVLFTN